MSDGDGSAGAFGPAPVVGNVQASLGELALDSHIACELAPQGARDVLSCLLHSDSVELTPTNDRGHEIAVTVDPRNPGLARFVRDEDAHPEGPPITGGTAP